VTSVQVKRPQSQPIAATTAVSREASYTGWSTVVLTVELDEESQLRPCEIDSCHESAVTILDDELSRRRRKVRDFPCELHHERLEQAFGWWRAFGSQREHSPHTTRARDPCACVFERFDRRELLAQR